MTIKHCTHAGAVIVAAMIALAGCSGRSSFVPGSVSQGAASPFSRQYVAPAVALRSLHRVCGPASPRMATCFAIATRYPVRVAQSSGTSNRRSPDASYGPILLQEAYNISSLVATHGKGQTVAIVDAYGYPEAKSDLAGYRMQFGLPKLCGTCFQIVNQNGGTTPPSRADSDWDFEQALDLDMVSAACPKCNIVLVETNTSYTTDLDAGVAAAMKKANVVSVSWGYGEQSSTDLTFDNHPKKVIVASSGDNGTGAEQPCSYAGVICVGGTSLTKSSSKRGWSEVVWDGLVKNECGSSGMEPCGTGSGCSSIVSKPNWQTDKGCTMRSEVDVSAVADPYTGVLQYFNGQCCYISGGTSVSAPLIAGMYGLAGNASKATPATLWASATSAKNAKKPKKSTSFYDVTKGTNERAGITSLCPKTYAYICKARKGYDGPTGWGTPNGLGAL